MIIDLRNKLIQHPDKRYSRRRLSAIESIVVHHSGDDRDSIESMARYHVDGHNWPGLSYHIAITNGEAYLINDIDKLTYHTKNYNAKSVGICMVGDYRVKLPSDMDLALLQETICNLQFILPSVDIIAHRDKRATECPGEALYNWIIDNV